MLPLNSDFLSEEITAGASTDDLGDAKAEIAAPGTASIGRPKLRNIAVGSFVLFGAISASTYRFPDATITNANNAMEHCYLDYWDEIRTIVQTKIPHEVSGIVRIPGVIGGKPIIVRTRIPVWLLIQAMRIGKTDEDLLASYPTLRTQDLVNARAYYEHNREEIDQQIEDNENA
ncbi:MAG: DUF433 domain-containing protein [Anaerolineae bacterium]|nr:DUF433 domain-containing protein [Anaerolineae bacterium]